MKKVAILQSNYLPWRGYFDIINDVDLFVFYDDVQFTKNDWRNRNQIKTKDGLQWISIPVGQKISRLVCEVEIADPTWQERHWRTICHAYGNAPHFKAFKGFFEKFYLGQKWTNLSELNQFLIRHISKDILGIDTEFTDSREYALDGKNLDRLMDILKKTGATHYVSGPAAKSYIQENVFIENKIELTYKDYSKYPVYKQLGQDFVGAVSIIDLIFNCGEAAPQYIWG